MTRVTFGFAALLLLSSFASPARGQTPASGTLSDARWTPWLGCWRLSQEETRDGTASLGAALARQARHASVPGLVVCVEPAGGGVTMKTFASGKIVLTQSVIADGKPHPVSQTGCEGTQTSEWSQDGERLFTSADIACSGRPAQKASGITLFGRGPVWVDAQTLDGGSGQDVRVRRYERSLDRPAEAADLSSDLTARAFADAQRSAATPISLDDVVEASRKVASSAVEAALVETGARFELDSKALGRLADAGVSPNVIDLMVAQSFPTEFKVDRPDSSGPMVTSTGVVGLPSAYGYGLPPYYAYDPFFYYYYSPFAYSYYYGSPYYRQNRYYLGGGTAFVGGDGSSGGGSTGGGAPNEHGRLVNGRGYTRVSPAGSGENDGSSNPSAHPVTGTRGVRSTGNGSDSSSSSSGSSSSSSSGSSDSSGGVSSSGYSGGGESSGRTAQPR